MKMLKDYVRSKARPERCIAEAYAMKETLGFCNEYMDRCQVERSLLWKSQRVWLLLVMT